MSHSPTDDRIKALITAADEAQTRHDRAGQFEALREASQLQPDNDRIRQRWHAWQTAGDVSHRGELLRTYVVSGRDEDARRLIERLKSGPLAPDQPATMLQLLLRASNASHLIDEVTAVAQDHQASLRALIATRLTDNATTIFRQMFERGDATFQAFTSIPYDATLWPGEERQVAAQRDVCRLCVATLMDAGLEQPARAMRALARQVATASDNLIDIIDEDVFDIVLSSLDLRRDKTLRSEALLAASKLLEAMRDRGEDLFAAFVTHHVAKHTNDDLITAFSAAAAVFPIVPVVASKLFMTDGFVQQLVPLLEANIHDAAVAGTRKSRTLEQAALELMSAGCVDKACRDAIQRYCAQWLRDLADEREGTHQALAALVLAKVSDEGLDDVTSKLSALVVRGDGESDPAIEGLAYTSLQPRVKEEIVGNKELLRQLVSALKDRNTTLFGCLTIFANLSAYRPVQSEEQKKMAQLKAYANASASSLEDPLEDDKHVTARCKKLLDADVVPSLVARCKRISSSTNVALVVRVLLALSKEQKHRPKMAQQGAVKLLLQTRERTVETDQSVHRKALVERNTAHALARLLISVNPAHVLSSSVPASSATSALLTLLHQDEQDQEEKDLLPNFEGLLALTNLASMEDAAARDLILRSSWERIENLLFSSNTLIQRASMELVCNLMASPTCIAKFADGSRDAQRRMQILLALADVEDLATRRAAGGALAMLTEWDAAVTAVLDAKDGRGVKVVLGMVEDEGEEMMHRGLVCLANVVNAPDEAGRRGLVAVKQARGGDVVREALKGCCNKDILDLGVEVLKQLG